MAAIGKYDGIKAEEDALAFWRENNIYQKAKEQTANGKNFYFLDGPPYTSGDLHIGTAWNKALKDCVLRYKRMHGFNVYDRAGYDMHGLPTALKVMEKLGLKHKDEIKTFGIKKFIEECKAFSIKNMDKMTEEFKRLGIWMDFENAYMPITQEFIEGEWWLIKKAHENKRLYEGEKTMHWCQHCATSLAKHELEYENVKDNSVFVKFKVKDKENEYFVIWTTTPWTLPLNMGIMVHPEFDYIKARIKADESKNGYEKEVKEKDDSEKEEIWIVAKGLAGAFINGVAEKEFEIVEEFKGKELEGMEFEHPLASEVSEFRKLKEKHPKMHTILLSDKYVDLSAGTGLVHTAPGCGPEDYEVGLQNNIRPFNNLNENGVFPDTMGLLSGFIAKKDDPKIVEELKRRGVLIAETPVEHEYPFCWRCKKPVIFRTTVQWFFRVEDMKEEMKELNKKIYWMPDWAGKKQFHLWLENLRDNGITRQRYWGTPLPIWRCDKCKDYVVIGNVKELESLGAQRPAELHIPWIDEVTFKCRKCPGTMKRLPDILDVWVDAGTTSWTCLDYPHKKELFDMMYPPDFILEGKDQIRGWFNLLFVASMVSMKSIAFKACYMHGFTNDALGRKMSKSTGNMISPSEVIDKYGADVFRYYSIGGANPGVDLNYNFDDMKVKHRNLSVLWNIHKFLIEYSEELRINPKDLEISEGELGIEEVYMLSKLNSTIKHVTMLFDEYKLNQVPLAVEELFLELSRTYIQLVRDKSASGSAEEKKIVLYTIYKVLYGILRLFVPIVPMLTEKIYQNIKNAFNLNYESIHFTGWPETYGEMIDKELEHAFDHVKSVIQAILSAREKSGLGVRWPVKEAIVVTKDEKVKKAVLELKDIIKTQTNIKDLGVIDRFEHVKQTIKTDFSKLGPDFGGLAPKIIARLMSESAETVLQHIEKDGKFVFEVDDRGEKKEVAIVNEHIILDRKVESPYSESEFRHGFVYLNNEMSNELLREGFSRELMRRVQSLRKKHSLQKSEEIELFVKADSKLTEMLKYHEQQIKEKVGARTLTFTELNVPDKFEANSTEKVRGREFEIFFNKIN